MITQKIRRRYVAEEKKTASDIPEEQVQEAVAAEGGEPEEQAQAPAAEGPSEEEGLAQEGVDTDALSKELEETRSQMLRIAAEADNFKKRMEREKEKLLKYAGENILRDLLSTVDNLDRALEQGQVVGGDPEQKFAAFMAGVELTKKGLDTMLERFAVTSIESVGQAFNPDQMDALTMEQSDTIPANHVVREFAKGYVFKDRVLRHAQVVVSSGPGPKTEQNATENNLSD
jgi:molecular chaperone GrpE